MSEYSKPYLAIPDQLELIKRRGLAVADDRKAMECLRRNGYYRLSAYWYSFRIKDGEERTDEFMDGSTFEHAVELYKFDKTLKMLLTDAMERVEISVRVEIALLLGKRGPFSHHDASTFHSDFTSVPNRDGLTGHEKWMALYQQKIKSSSEEFVTHHKKAYGENSPMPIWIAIELWDFGLLSHAYSGLKISDRRIISSHYGIPDWRVMESWLRSLNYVRNIIAHHRRLWNANISVHPRLPARGLMPPFDPLLELPRVNARIYSVCCILAHFSRAINPESSWISDFKEFIKSFPNMPYASPQAMGFPTDWETHDFWK